MRSLSGKKNNEERQKEGDSEPRFVEMSTSFQCPIVSGGAEGGCGGRRGNADVRGATMMCNDVQVADDVQVVDDVQGADDVRGWLSISN